VVLREEGGRESDKEEGKGKRIHGHAAASGPQAATAVASPRAPSLSCAAAPAVRPCIAEDRKKKWP
jgi:hypothetical protein